MNGSEIVIWRVKKISRIRMHLDNFRGLLDVRIDRMTNVWVRELCCVEADIL